MTAPPFAGWTASAGFEGGREVKGRRVPQKIADFLHRKRGVGQQAAGPPQPGFGVKFSRALAGMPPKCLAQQGIAQAEFFRERRQIQGLVAAFDEKASGFLQFLLKGPARAGHLTGAMREEPEHMHAQRCEQFGRALCVALSPVVTPQDDLEQGRGRGRLDHRAVRGQQLPLPSGVVDAALALQRRPRAAWCRASPRVRQVRRRRRANPFRNSPEWGSACILAPWQQYQFSGDLELLSRRYEGMKRYVAYLGSKAKDHILDFGLGDWYDIGPRPPGPSQLTPKAQGSHRDGVLSARCRDLDANRPTPESFRRGLGLRRLGGADSDRVQPRFF